MKPARPRTDPDEVREKILEVAEEQFRRLGYQKTTVADIADSLGMSAANVYRFFQSKSAINQCICARLLDGAIELAWRHVRAGGDPAERLEALLVAMHRHNRETLIQERRMHDMVAAAVSEHWENVKTYKERLNTIIEGLIREGVDAGQFAVDDPRVAADCVLGCFGMLLHPVMIEQCIDEDLDAKARQMARFVVRALRPTAAG